MTSEIRVMGTEAETRGVDDFDRLYGDEVAYEIRGEVRIGEGRSEVREVILDGDDDDVLEIEDTDGFVTFRRVSSLLEQTAAAQRSDDVGGVVRDVAEADGLGPVRVARRVKVSLPEEIADAADAVDRLLGGEGPLDPLTDVVFDRAAEIPMKAIVDWIDKPARVGDENWHQKLKPPGLYRTTADLNLRPGDRVPDGTLARSDEPWLLLIHGTFSHTEGGFSGLRDRSDFGAFAGHYRDRVLAAEHPTLGCTPTQNAVDIARALPEGTRLHLLTHSRGGLVGDVLALAAGEEWPGLDAYEARGHDDHPDVAALQELRSIVAEREITVERFARVACPAQGTILASRRLDRYAKYLFNAVNLVPGVGQSGLAAIIKKFLLALLDKRSDPRLVPGIEAMMPESPFIAFLNSAPQVHDGMATIAGDVEGRGIMGRIKVFAADVFFRSDHDYVVDSPAMSGGVARSTPRVLFDQGPEVSHFNYFSRDRTRAGIIRWLEADQPDVEDFTDPARRLPAPERGAEDPPAGLVIVVPDLFGSTLVDEREETVWPSAKAIAADGLTATLNGAAELVPRGVVPVYAPLAAELERRFDVEWLVYDWRRTAEDTAEQLRHDLERLTGSHPKGAPPVHVVALGAGVFRYLAARRLSTGGAVGAVERTVLVSPPFDGSWRYVRMAQGQDELTARLALLDPGTTPQAAGEFLADLPGIAEVLPSPARPADRRAVVDGPLGDAGGGVMLFGSQTPTIVGWNEESGEFVTSPSGDGHVVTAGMPRQGSTTLFAPGSYTSLVAHPTGSGYITELLLDRGTPGSLLHDPPPPAGVEQGWPASAHRVVYPTDADLGSASLPSVPRGSLVPGRPLRLTVTHGRLEQVIDDRPIIVGSYDGIPIGGAEKALDAQLDGRLSRRLALGRLAGRLETCDVFRRDGAPVAAVVGMGAPGELTADQLTAAVAQAGLELALARAEWDETDRGLSVAAVLIGTGGVGGLGVTGSVSAIAHGIRRANRHLEEAGPGIRIDALEFVELYEDRAIQAAEAALDLAVSVAESVDRGQHAFVAEPFLHTGCDGQLGLPPREYHQDQWRTIRVSAAPEGSRSDDAVALSFTSIGRSARAEQQVGRLQRRLVDQLIENSIHQPWVEPSFYNTMYELLVPNAIKGQDSESDHLMFVLDAAASTLPYELLATSTPGENPAPLATRVGILRRLETASFRESVRRSAGRRALVVGDPAAGRPRLAAARVEARVVADVLEERGYQVTRVISKDSDDQSVTATRIMNALFEHDYRVVHIAAHGEFIDEEDNGIVIGDGLRLSAREIGQLRTTPDLVFLNACHVGSLILRSRLLGGGDEAADLGSSLNTPGRLAGSLARQLIDDGVRAVVAAVWAVDDRAAAEFASTLYRGLLAGRDLGSSVLAARQHIYRGFPHVNTWGAYQVYGPPAMKLHTAGGRDGREERLASRRQLLHHLDALRRESQSANTEEAIRGAEATLDELVATVPDAWIDGEALDRMADILFTLGRYQRTVETYRDALRSWGGAARLKAIEQLANAEAKWAHESPAEAGGWDEVARKRIDGLVDLIPKTPERLAIRGSFYRRRAAAAEEPLDDLSQALESYREAMGLQESAAGGVDFYTGLNWVVLESLLTDPQDRDVAALRSTIDACAAAAKNQRCQDFWSRVATADADLARALVDDTVEPQVPALVQSYAGATRTASEREFRSILEHLAIIGSLLEKLGKHDAASAVGIVRDQVEATRRSRLGG